MLCLAGSYARSGTECGFACITNTTFSQDAKHDIVKVVPRRGHNDRGRLVAQIVTIIKAKEIAL
ncbi:MAG: hypothetical protein Kow0063_30080 [Anaerolineae bacterium]